MNVEAQRKLLEGMLLQLDGLASSVSAALAMTEPEAEQPCTHPQEDRLDQSTFAVERWKCRRCGFEVERPQGSE